MTMSSIILKFLWELQQSMQF